MHSIIEIDVGTLFFFQNHRLPWLNALMLGLTRLGDDIVLLILGSLFALLLLYRQRWRTALVYAVATLSAWGTSHLVKILVHRKRPDESVDVLEKMPPTFSFPSGHAMGSMAVYGIAALLATRFLTSRRQKSLLIASAMLLSVLIGFSRMYLGVHFLSDVLGGWCGGLAFALLARWVDDRWTATGPKPIASPHSMDCH